MESWELKSLEQKNALFSANVGNLLYLCTEKTIQRKIMTTRREKSKPQKPQINKQLEVVEAKEPKEEQSIAFEAGKFCLDIAKLVFGGVILAGIMQQGIEFNSLFLTGLGVVLLFVAFGFYLIKKSKKNRR